MDHEAAWQRYVKPWLRRIACSAFLDRTEKRSVFRQVGITISSCFPAIIAAWSMRPWESEPRLTFLTAMGGFRRVAWTMKQHGGRASVKTS